VLVLLFHAGVSWLPGGWLGVDVFFVLSGYLITSLLLAEHAGEGRIRLGRFWARRVRRLLPALLLTITAVLACARWLVAPEERPLLRGDALAALAYVANWRMIDRGTGYVALTAAPSPLQNTWSLAIEEQFYLLWPLVVAGAFTLATLRAPRRTAPGDRPGPAARRGAGLARRWLGLLAAAGAIASAVAMAVTAGADEPGATYYGSGTRCFGLLAGCTLAVLLHRRARADATRRAAAAGAGAIATVVALGVLVLACARLRDSERALYHGGLALVVLAVAVLIARVETRPDGVAARLLAVPPLAAVGRISYGLYLWHWPTFLLLDAERTGLDGVGLAAVRIAATAALASVSYVVVEQPIRTGRWPLRIRRPVPGRAAGVPSPAAHVPSPAAGGTAVGGPLTASAAVAAVAAVAVLAVVTTGRCPSRTRCRPSRSPSRSRCGRSHRRRRCSPVPAACRAHPASRSSATRSPAASGRRCRRPGACRSPPRPCPAAASPGSTRCATPGPCTRRTRGARTGTATGRTTRG